MIAAQSVSPLTRADERPQNNRLNRIDDLGALPLVELGFLDRLVNLFLYCLSCPSGLLGLNLNLLAEPVVFLPRQIEFAEAELPVFDLSDRFALGDVLAFDRIKLPVVAVDLETLRALLKLVE